MPESPGGNLLVQLLILLGLVIVNGLFSMSEMAIISMRRARLQQLSDEGDERATAALNLATDPNNFLSTIQIGITTVGILAGTYGGATLAPELARILSRLSFLRPYASGVSYLVAVLGTTFLSLVIGELVPKRVALQYSERISLSVAKPMTALAGIAGPLVRLLSGSTDALARTFGIEGYAEAPVTEDEIRVLVEQGASAGIIDEVERELVDRVFHMGEEEVIAIMRPRTEVMWLDVDSSPEELREAIESSPYSRFPVAREGLDNILGLVHGKDLLHQCMAGEPLDLEKALVEPLYIPETMRVFHVLEQFKQAGVPIALAVDEYGVFQGLVTLDDILEGLVGDIPELDELEEPMAVQREDGSWLLDGLMPVDDFKTLFALGELPQEDDYQTLGGFVVAQLGRIPSVTDEFTWADLRLEVVDMDGNRVDKVLATPLLGLGSELD